MLRKAKLAGYCFCGGYSVGVVGFLISNSLGAKGDIINNLWWLLCFMLIISIGAAFILKERISPKSLWIRRGFLMLISILSFILTRYLFGYLTNTKELLMAVITIVIVVPLCTGITYILVDKAEKRYLQRVNDKLRQMNGNQEKQ